VISVITFTIDFVIWGGNLEIVELSIPLHHGKPQGFFKFEKVSNCFNKKSTVCVYFQALLHYFILSSFMWMLVEGILQCLRFVKVIATYIPNFMIKSMIPAWGKLIYTPPCSMTCKKFTYVDFFIRV